MLVHVIGARLVALLLPGRDEIIYFPWGLNPKQAAALIAVDEIALFHAMVEKIARYNNVLSAIAYEIFPFTFTEPPDGLKTVPPFRAPQRPFRKMSQAHAKTKPFMNLAQDVESGQPLQAERRVGPKDPVIET